MRRRPSSTLFPYTTLFRSCALAAQQATREIPIVTISGDPVGLGLVESLARPGGNITGISLMAAELHGKRDRKSTRLNSSHQIISYAVFCLKKKRERHALRT